MSSLRPTPRLIESVKEYGNKLPMTIRADKLETLVLRDFDFTPGKGWEACEVKGLGYASSLETLKALGSSAGMIGRSLASYDMSRPLTALPPADNLTFYSIRRQGMDTMNANKTTEADLRVQAGHNVDSWTFVVRLVPPAGTAEHGVLMLHFFLCFSRRVRISQRPPLSTSSPTFRDERRTASASV